MKLMHVSCCRTLASLYDVETKILDKFELDCSSWKKDGEECMERTKSLRDLVN